MPTVCDVIQGLERQAPQELAAPWDHVGLQVGSPEQPVKRIYISLDPTLEVVRRAIDKRCELLITHHPIYLSPPQYFDFSQGVGEILALALRHRLSIYAAHTNLDAAHQGLNDRLCELLDLQHCVPLEPVQVTPTAFYKLVTFVPAKHLSKVTAALFAAGAGKIGNYENCSFRLLGTGTYRGNAETSPAIGEAGAFMEVEEERLEVLVAARQRHAVEQALRASHPYEEVAFDWVPLAAPAASKAGLGRVGLLNKAVLVADYCAQLKQHFKVNAFRFIGKQSGRVKKIALCSGSGASFIGAAARAGADLYITGDIKYHDALAAKALGLRVADLGHFATEHWAVDLLAKMVQNRIPKGRSKVGIYRDQSQKDPFIFV